MNNVSLIGRITKDVELRTTSSGISCVIFTLATDRAYKDSNGEKQTDFINCVAWKQAADFMSKYVKKGNKLGITGSIQTRSYENQNGNMVYVTEVICNNVENLTPRDNKESETLTPILDDSDLPF